MKWNNIEQKTTTILAVWINKYIVNKLKSLRYLNENYDACIDDD